MLVRKGEKLNALYVVDRRCRKAHPLGRDYLVRSLALSELGFSDEATRDLRRAEEFGYRDLVVLRWLMSCHPDLERRRAAAYAIISDGRSSRSDGERAIKCLFLAGDHVVVHAMRLALLIFGWIACLEHHEPILEVRFADGRTVRPEVRLERFGIGVDAVTRAHFSVVADPALSAVVTGWAGEAFSRPTMVYAALTRADDIGENVRTVAKLHVIVPVFGDPSSLAACLDALACQQSDDVAFIVIDDSSPDHAVVAQAQRFCRQNGGRYHRTALNAGFAASVNVGLSFCSQGDVIILNSDVILPMGALNRLMAAANRVPDVGTVCPLSNDAGEASFPDALRANPAFDDAERIAIDDAAKAANHGEIVDLLAPLGSCLYLTRTALDRVGRLDLSYGRGYYEDVDLYLRVREAGLRNIAACDVYVSHLGGRSFGVEKQALVARNHAIIRRRFPGFEFADLLFDLADPLKDCRAAIEQRLHPVLDGVVIIVARAFGSETLIDWRVQAWKARGRPSLVMRWQRDDLHHEVKLAVPDGPGPRSLRYPLSDDGIEVLALYLERLQLPDIEVLEPEVVPDAVCRLLERLRRPINLLVASLASAQASGLLTRSAADTNCLGGAMPNPDPVSLYRGSSPTATGTWSGASETIVAPDRMAAAYLGVAVAVPSSPDPIIRAVGGSVVAAITPAVPSRAILAHHSSPSFRKANPSRISARSMVTLGLLLPVTCPTAERFVLGLARALRRSDAAHLIVLGRPINENQLLSPGNVWVTGPMLDDRPAVISALYGVDGLVSPYRDSLFWYIDHARLEVDLPIAYFDWSGGRVKREDGDLALDHLLRDEEAISHIAQWCDQLRALWMPGAIQ